ncbi:hypothetical protein FA13DRAFT_1708581 [Coprinellus micaceus]|uniref:Uncharacterized protein n=1 Tax=Coprinellus micaceus TaxID=71717 RepID=A0A4Y7TH18_COPMI|nr:hypothetical protein FA13DRAFT_1708581 [Coprinellus micaceus]
MDQCLHIPEILRAICDETTKKTALAVALTSRHFLQPGLDRIWREVDCFEAIIACLPTDLWEVEESGGYLEPKLHFLRRPITSSDMERYKTHYAPRIRYFALKMVEGSALFGLDAFQGIQLATQWQPGALAPLLKQLAWPYSFTDTNSSLRAEDYFQETFPLCIPFPRKHRDRTGCHTGVRLSPTSRLCPLSHGTSPKTQNTISDQFATRGAIGQRWVFPLEDGWFG